MDEVPVQLYVVVECDSGEELTEPGPYLDGARWMRANGYRYASELQLVIVDSPETS
jgi:hypothetical protein